MFQFPCLIVNFKNYAATMGQAGVALSKLIEKKSKQHNVPCVLAVNPVYLKTVAETVSIPVISQHVDSQPTGACTGAILAESLALVGAVGALVNHSEKKVETNQIHAYINACKRGVIDSIVCADSLEQALQVQACNPSAICYEPTELIGGNVSVANSDPELVSAIAEQISLPLFIGAGIKTRQDVIKSLALGAQGVLVASAICKAQDPAAVLDELLLGFK